VFKIKCSLFEKYSLDFKNHSLKFKNRKLIQQIRDGSKNIEIMKNAEWDVRKNFPEIIYSLA